MKPDFSAMTKSQLRAYVLEHRDDDQAFYALADRILANPNLKWYAPEDVERFPEIYEEHRKRKEADQNSIEPEQN
ncbi:DUF6887 family protein [Leptolyngbya sp. AN03gr2]|uniref:DUF6887 family protein n=1 Tax=unclassified Leptolyngbya TaxID=2650499 RepID=UPI003D321749